MSGKRYVCELAVCSHDHKDIWTLVSMFFIIDMGAVGQFGMGEGHEKKVQYVNRAPGDDICQDDTWYRQEKSEQNEPPNTSQKKQKERHNKQRKGYATNLTHIVSPNKHRTNMGQNTRDWSEQNVQKIQEK